MPNFADFNFGDDAPGPDTDPTADDVLPDNDPSYDNKQNDQTDYPEPGQDDVFTGGDPTTWDVQGNPEEPGAQVDHMPPVSRLRQMFSEETADVLDNYTYPNEPRSLLLNKLIVDMGGEQELEDLYAEYAGSGRDPRTVLLYKLLAELHESKAESSEKPRKTPGSALSVREMIDAYNNLPETHASVREMIDAYNNLDDTHTSVREMIEAYNNLDDTHATIREMFDAYNNLDDTHATIREMFDAYSNLDNTSFTVLEQLIGSDNYELGTVLDAADIAILSQFSNIDRYALLERIFGSEDLADSEHNPSGIGEMFDRLVISGFDASLDQLNNPNTEDLEGLDSNDYLSLVERTFDSGLDTFDDGIDIQSYMGDTFLNSNIIEFQDLGNGSLENWDGLL